MPFVGNSDVPGLRSATTAAEMQAAFAKQAIEKQEADDMAAKVFVLLLVIGLVAVFLLYQRRRNILNAAERLAITSAATGLNTSRTIGETLGRFADRVRRRADEQRRR